MIKRIFLFGAVAIVAAVSHEAFGQAPDVKLFLFPLTGEVRIANDGSTDLTFVFYSLSSPSRALNGTNGVWTSIADTYDASGNGFIDATHEWTKLTPNPTAHATNLSESVFTGPGGVLPAHRALSLGKIWDPSGSPIEDVTALIGPPVGKEFEISDDVTIDGDYLRDKIVDPIDYELWKSVFGSTSDSYADGNIDGIVDAADYTVWRNNFALSISGSGSGESGAAGGAQSVAPVPEPSGIFLGLLAGIGYLLCRPGCRRRSSS